MMKRSRISTVKLIIALPLAYFTIVGVLTTLTGRGFLPDNTADTGDPLQMGNRDLLHNDDLNKWDKNFHNPLHYPDKMESRKPHVAHQNPLQPPVDRYVDRDAHIVQRIQQDNRQREEQLRREKNLQAPPPDNDESVLHKMFAPRAPAPASTRKKEKKSPVDPDAPGKLR